MIDFSRPLTSRSPRPHDSVDTHPVNPPTRQIKNRSVAPRKRSHAVGVQHNRIACPPVHPQRIKGPPSRDHRCRCFVEEIDRSRWNCVHTASDDRQQRHTKGRAGSQRSASTLAIKRLASPPAPASPSSPYRSAAPMRPEGPMAIATGVPMRPSNGPTRPETAKCGKWSLPAASNSSIRPKPCGSTRAVIRTPAVARVAATASDTGAASAQSASDTTKSTPPPEMAIS